MIAASGYPRWVIPNGFTASILCNLISSHFIPTDRKSPSRQTESMIRSTGRRRICFLFYSLRALGALRGDSFSFLFLDIVKAYHGVSEGRANGIDSADWIWISECPVGPNPASAFLFLGSNCFEPQIAQINADFLPSFLP